MRVNIFSATSSTGRQPVTLALGTPRPHCPTADGNELGGITHVGTGLACPYTAHDTTAPGY
ncbi:hypothetical protein ACFYVL_31825 [Streptomyces sp. NPDC004111]|uniref:hypothetical protein n=1 Tax=Streptomyces sp. NPDC004111 TaxID=3364690 RepID=UPI003689F541